jgi:deoxyguanosine kinase
MYLVVEGVIGVGKTSLSRLLQPVFNADIQLEVFEENPFLSNFYADRKRYAFQTQIFFLLSRYRQQFELTKRDLEKENLISDYSFAKDSIFAVLNLDGDELATYYSVHNALAERIPDPDLTIYLQASTDIAMERIALRDREYERNMDRSYIHDLNQSYEEHYRQHPENVLTIDTSNLDFVHKPEHLNDIIHRIRTALGIPPFQPELPFSGIG